MGRFTDSHVGRSVELGGSERSEWRAAPRRAEPAGRSEDTPTPPSAAPPLPLSPSIARLRLEANERTCPQAQDKGPPAGGPDVLCAANKIQTILVDFQEGKTCDLRPLGFA